MYTRGHSSDKNTKRSSQRKSNYSGEFVAFESARYFPTIDDDEHANRYIRNVVITRQERGRISLDLPLRPSSYQIQYHKPLKQDVICTDDNVKGGDVKRKQPNSPGGRIASFLNSLFHTTGSKKGKLKSKPKSRSKSGDEQEEVLSPGGWRRRRRSSISHFLLSSSRSNANATTNSSTAKSVYCSSSSGFRSSPPPYVITPTKNYKEFLSYAGHQKQVVEDSKREKDLSWLDEKLKLIETLSDKRRVWADDVGASARDDQKEKLNGKIKKDIIDEKMDDGAESDSSSDLFELPNYYLSRGGLPVYETTNAENIKINAPISNIC